MILLFITVVALIIGVMMLSKGKYNDFIFGTGLIFTILSGFIVFTMVIWIIGEHVGVNAKIEQNRIEYESLCKRYEMVTSEYEDVSKSDVIKDIAEWNKKVYSYKYWAYNPWTNCFFSKKFADSMELIETGKVDVK